MTVHQYACVCSPMSSHPKCWFLTAPDVSQVSIYMELSHICKQGTACLVMWICTWWLEYTIPRPLDGLVLYWLENSLLILGVRETAHNCHYDKLSILTYITIYYYYFFIIMRGFRTHRHPLFHDENHRIRMCQLCNGGSGSEWEMRERERESGV